VSEPQRVETTAAKARKYRFWVYQPAGFNQTAASLDGGVE
jgi:hypothetical protein